MAEQSVVALLLLVIKIADLIRPSLIIRPTRMPHPPQPNRLLGSCLQIRSGVTILDVLPYLSSTSIMPHPAGTVLSFRDLPCRLTHPDRLIRTTI